MRVLSYFTLFGLCGSLFAEEVDLQESKKIIAPQSGLYVGLGLVTSNDKYDFSLNSFSGSLSADHYEMVSYQRNQRNYNGQLFIGYQIVAPFFAALELSYTLSKASAEKMYSCGELAGGNDAYANSAHLTMKYGNDLSLKLKVGKSFSIGCGNSCRHITPYVVLGMHERSIDASFDYPVPTGTQVGEVDDFSYANHRMKSRKLGFVWGLGASIAFEKEFSIGVEYNCRKMGSLHEQRILPKNPSGGPNNIDKLDTPRFYSINGKDSHSLTIWLSKNISFK